MTRPRLSERGLVILSIFLRNEGLIYGYDILVETKASSGAVYPILHRLEQAGWLRSWVEPGTARSLRRRLRRYYALTPKGQKEARRVFRQFPSLETNP